jgi:hypothetical protein
MLTGNRSGSGDSHKSAVPFVVNGVVLTGLPPPFCPLVLTVRYWITQEECI